MNAKIIIDYPPLGVCINNRDMKVTRRDISRFFGLLFLHKLLGGASKARDWIDKESSEFLGHVSMNKRMVDRIIKYFDCDIKEITSIFNTVFKENWKSGGKFSVDENMIAWQGSTGETIFTICIPRKPTKIGVRFFLLVEKTTRIPLGRTTGRPYCVHVYPDIDRPQLSKSELTCDLSRLQNLLWIQIFMLNR